MKVTLLNHSDVRGGASVVSMRLLDALRRAGVDARMVVTHRAHNDPNVALAGPAWRRRAAFLAECAQIYTHNGFSREYLFKVSTGAFGLPLHRHPWVEDADIVCLNWVNQGMISLRDIARIKAPLVWTMHDMWCATGVCHHAGVCERFTADCGHCPLICDGTRATDLSTEVWRHKNALYQQRPIRFVAVSSWLESRCRDSLLLRDADISVIPNAFPVEKFATVPTFSRAELGIPEDKKIIVFGAERIDDPIKGLTLAIDALNQITDTDAHIVFFGRNRSPRILDSLRLGYTFLGPIANADRLRSLYAHASVVLSSSHYESLPGTLIEGMASGAVPVAFDHGGQSDIINHKVDGFLAVYPDTHDMARQLRRALKCDFSRSDLHRAVADRFSADAVATRYIDLFNTLL